MLLVLYQVYRTEIFTEGPLLYTDTSIARLCTGGVYITLHTDAFFCARVPLPCRSDGQVLPTLESHPDCPFVEDTVVYARGVAVTLRQGHESRRGEVDSVR